MSFSGHIMPDTHILQLSGRAVAYGWSHGPCARPMVVLHGLGDSSLHAIAPRFADTSLRDTPALFIDLPGFGEATADDTYPATIDALTDDVATVLRSLGIAGTTIFGHSMGANVGMLLAYRYPQLAERLILAEPLLRAEHSVLATGIARFSEEVFVERGYRMLARATSLQAHRGDLAAAAFGPTLAMANPRSMHRAASSLIAPRDPGFLAMVSTITFPTTLLIGARTPVNVDDMHLDGVKVMRIAGAGHSMLIEAPEPTACAMLLGTS